MLGGGGLTVSPSSSASSQGGTQGGTTSSFSPTFYSPFAVGPNASATATGAGGGNMLMWVVGLAAVAAIGVAAYAVAKKK